MKADLELLGKEVARPGSWQTVARLFHELPSVDRYGTAIPPCSTTFRWSLGCSANSEASQVSEICWWFVA